MKREKFLTAEQEKEISNLITRFEDKTRSEFSVVIAQDSSSYTTATMRFAVIFTFLFSFLFTIFYHVNEERLLVLGMFILFLFFYKLGTVNFFKRLFLAENEFARKVDHRAFQIFHQWIKSKTTHEKNILLYISLFERKFDLIVDREIKNYLPQNEVEEIAEKLTPHFQEEHFYTGLVTLITQLEEGLEKKLGEHTSPLESEHNDLIIWSEDLPQLY